MKYLTHILVICIIATTSCGNDHKKASQQTNLQSKEFQDKLVAANKMYVKRESDEIDQYVVRHNWTMITTGTGLRYMITKRGEGKELAQPDQRAKMNFKISLLDGTLCYSSDSTGAKEFTIGRDNIESGLHEGVQYLHTGDRAVFILPSHLAHGLIGDESKIPPQASVVYEVELISLK